MDKKDLTVGIISMAIAATVYIQAGTFSETSKFFPRLIAGGIFIVGVLILIDAFRAKVVPEKGRDEDFNLFGVFSIVVLLAVYLVLLQTLGYIISTFVLIYVGAYLQGYRNYKAMLISAVLISTTLYLLFTKVFYVHFPGIL